MKVKYLATVATVSMLSLGVVVGCANPCAGKVKMDSTEETANPCAGKANPCAGKANPCASKSNPCAGK